MKNKVVFRNEAAVRGWLKKQARDRLFWIEAAQGGTVGLMDVLLALDGRLEPIELKVGSPILALEEANFVDFILRPSQRKVARQMANAGVRSYIVVGELGGCRMWIYRGHPVGKDMPPVAEVHSLNDIEWVIRKHRDAAGKGVG